MDLDLAKLLGSFGFAGALLLILYRVLTAQGEAWSKRQSEGFERLVLAVDRIGQKVDDHAATEVEHHTAVHVAIARLEGKIDGAADERTRSGLTPIEGVPTIRAASEPGLYGVGRRKP